MFVFAEGMDSKAVEQFRGRISSALPLLSLITAGGNDSDENEVHQTGVFASDEVKMEVEEGLQRHGEMGQNLDEELQNPEEEVQYPDQVVIDRSPELQEPIQVLQDAGKNPPELVQAIRMLKRALRANGYGFPDFDPVINTLIRMGKDPAEIIEGVAQTMLSRAQRRNSPTQIAPQAIPQKPIHEDGKLWKFDDENWEDEELYWTDKFKNAKTHQLATETVSFVTRRKLFSYFHLQIIPS
jgi:hypothetical protein